MVRRVLAGTIVLLWAVQFAAVFIAPFHDDDLMTADAVIVLSGDHGDRLSLGLRLVRGGAAPALVILNPRDGQAVRSGPLCTEPQPFEVRCPTPALVSTIGDVREIDALAAEAGWHRVIVVTSSFHVSRSRLLMARCSDIEVDVRGSSPDLSTRVWVRAIAHEAGGMAQALLFLRC